MRLGADQHTALLQAANTELRNKTELAQAREEGLHQKEVQLNEQLEALEVTKRLWAVHTEWWLGQTEALHSNPAAMAEQRQQVHINVRAHWDSECALVHAETEDVKAKAAAAEEAAALSATVVRLEAENRQAKEEVALVRAEVAR